MNNILKRINETGTLLVEALAMLGLISMVTPVLYKKAAERTTELQDINASSQLRAIATAMDAYLKDNFAKITRGETISANGIPDADFSNFQNNVTSAIANIDVSALRDYLPYGMMIDGEMNATKLFANTKNNQGENSNYKIVVRLNRDVDGGGQPIAETLTGFIIAEPKSGMVNNTRAARIASMVGSNGGVTEFVPETGEDPASFNVNGTQGIWTVTEGDLGGNNLNDNTLVISSLQPITSQGLSNENVLYRVDMTNDGDQELNSMTTDLFMGIDEAHSRNIRMVNQIVMTPDANRMVGTGNATTNDRIDPDGSEADLAADINNALYISNGGGANVEGALQAIGQRFQVMNGAINYFGTHVMELPEGNQDLVNEEATFHVGIDNLTYGNPTGGMIFDVTDNNLRYRRRSDNRESLNVAENTLEAMDKTLLVDKNGDGFVTIGAGGSPADQFIGKSSKYKWEDVGGENMAIEVAFDDQEYRLTIDGSIFASDTIYSGKSKSFDADSAKLRAGTKKEHLENSNNDSDYFMKVEYTNQGANLFRIGTNESNTLIRASDYDQYKGVIVNVNPGNTGGVGGGINLIAGDTAILNSTGTKTNDTPQSGEVLLGASSGVFVSTYNSAGSALNPDTPVSIQGTMLQAYNDASTQAIDENGDPTYVAGGHTIDVRTKDFFATNESANNNGSRYLIEGMQFDVGRYQSGNNAETIIGANSKIGRSSVTARSILNILPNNYGAPDGSEYGKVTTRITGGVGFYDYDADISDDRNNPSSTTHPAALFVDKGKFEIRSTEPITTNDSNGSVSTVLSTGVLVLAVDNNMSSYYGNNTNRYGSIYIRRGGINIDSTRTRLTNEQIAEDYPGNGGTPNPSSADNLKGYIAADRFISHYSSLGEAADQAAISFTKALAKADGFSSNVNDPYTKYEVNPAYTSVMHDIKLTTRGGARLSDILPDFINKGIYVVDTSYKESSVGNWVATFDVDLCKPNSTNTSSCDATSPTDKVSAYVGFVPTPKCPAGYAKVITLTPAGWAMAQAGKLTGTQDGISGPVSDQEIYLPDPAEVLTQNSNTASDATPIYLDYQKSTWLRSEVRPVYNGMMNPTSGVSTANFNGWGLIMGFIYPYSKYGNLVPGSNTYSDTAYYHGAGAGSTGSGGSASNDTIYWNLFPVYNNEIEGYATVYCYFDRFANGKDENGNNVASDGRYIDKYNQLGQFKSGGAASVNSYGKDTNYKTRLNDDRLNYNDPW